MTIAVKIVVSNNNDSFSNSSTDNSNDSNRNTYYSSISVLRIDERRGTGSNLNLIYGQI